MQRANRMFLIAAIFLMTLTPSVAFASSGLEDAIINLGTDLFGADAVAGTSGGLVGPAFFVLSVICYILGLVIMFQSLVRLSRASQFSGGFSPTQSLYAGPLVGFIIAGALIGLPDTWRAFNETIFTGTGATNILAYDGVAFASVVGVPIPSNFDLFMTVLVLIVQFIGWIAFVRGLLMIKRAAEGSGQASYGTAITHIFGGVLAANLIATVDMIQQTLCRSACIVNI
jgi:intracellular multiplication protein IcmC